MKRTLLILFYFFNLCCISCAERPRLVLGFVIDQLSHSKLMQLAPFMNGGIKKLISNGTLFCNALMPHSQPSTFPGHLALMTGCYPCVHGGVANDWRDAAGNVRACDDDDPKLFGVFSPTGLYKYGKSPRSIMVDTLSDTCVMNTEHPFSVYAISLKSRSAIAMAGRLGKAIWYDGESGIFTSSKAYFEQLPAWLLAFNKKRMSQVVGFNWKLFFEPSHKAYASSTKLPSNFARKDAPFNILTSLKQKGASTFYRDLQQVPFIHQLELECAQECLQQALAENQDGTIIVWICLSSVDKVGHIYGPDSQEYTDMLYHLDAQLGNFIEFASSKIDPQQTLYVLTADHGCARIPDLLAMQGFSLARRINSLETIKNINATVKKKVGVKNSIIGIDAPNVYLNQKVISRLPLDKKKEIVLEVKHELENIDGIKKVWTFDELNKLICLPEDEAWVFKKQLFPGRSGDLIFQVYPYTLVNKFSTGTGHKTPYRYDTHVPLIFYQPGKLTSKEIQTKVYIQQAAPTLALLLGADCPSAATFDALITY